jgi:ADP-heptose:LPS heptosyltransferase
LSTNRIALQKLLIIHQGALGDLIAIFPAIHRLRNSFDRIDVVCQSQLGKLVQYLGPVTQWFPLEATSFSSLFTNQPDPEIKALLIPYDQVILFSSSAELEQSLHQITQNRCIRLAPKPPVDQPIHITAYALQKLTRCGFIRKEYLDSDDFCQPQNARKKSNIQRDRNKILLHPGSGSRRKRWPLSQFKHVEKQLNANGLKTEFVLGPAEKDLLNKLENRDRKIHVPSDLIALAALYKTASGYIGNDSGASHLAAVMGLPTEVIFGPADPQRWKPNGPYVEVVRPKLKCLPCFETDQTNCPKPKCLDDTTPRAVIEAFYRLYES